MSYPPRIRSAVILTLLSSAILAMSCSGQPSDVVCDEGYGSFQWRSKTGVTIAVDAPRSRGFASHSCQATLSWNGNETVIASDDDQVDLDALGVDLGLGTPIVALQTRKLSTDKTMSYEIYALSKPPRQLRVITGGDWFSAADTDLGGHIEIWTGDAAAADGFDEIPLSAFDFAPPVVLRFDGKQLIDVSAQFRSAYDRRITSLRSQLDAAQLNAFKQSDGTLKSLYPPTPAEWARLRQTKIRVLEIVWCSLYSGRPQEAWDTLAELWPASDVERIHAAILDARAHGIGLEVDRVATQTTPNWKKRHEAIYETPPEIAQAPPPSSSRWGRLPMQNSEVAAGKLYADTFPIGFLLRRPPFAPGMGSAEPIPMDLIIDSAGKVRSAKTVGQPDPALIEATKGWKFVPAFKNGHPVACHLRMNVTPAQ